MSYKIDKKEPHTSELSIYKSLKQSRTISTKNNNNNYNKEVHLQQRNNNKKHKCNSTSPSPVSRQTTTTPSCSLSPSLPSIHSYRLWSSSSLRSSTINNEEQETSEAATVASYQQIFFKRMRQFLDSSTCDISVQLDEHNAEPIKAHRLVLSCSSPFLRDKLGQLQPGENVLRLARGELGGADLTSLKFCLEYMYSGGGMLGQGLTVHASQLKRFRDTAKTLRLGQLHAMLKKLMQDENRLKKQEKILSTTNSSNIESAEIGMKNEQLLTAAAYHQLVLAQMNENYANMMAAVAAATAAANRDSSISNVVSLKRQREKSSSSSKIKDNSDRVSETGKTLLEHSDTLRRVFAYLAGPQGLSRSEIEVDMISRDFQIKNKYIYPSMLIVTAQTASDENETSTRNTRKEELAGSDVLQDFTVEHFLKKYLDNFSFVAMTSSDEQSISQGVSNHSHNQFNRHALLIFSLHLGELFKFTNFIVKTRLNLADVDDMRENVRLTLEGFLNKALMPRLRSSAAVGSADSEINAYRFAVTVNRVAYLKKPSNCKVVRLETLRTSTDCFRAIVEYSQANLKCELPFVFCTPHASVRLVRRRDV